MKRLRSLGAFGVLATVGLIVSAAGGAETYWQLSPPAVGDWWTASAWSQGVPQAGTAAIMVNGGTATLSSGQAEAGQLLVAKNYTAHFIQTGGSLTLRNYNYGSSLFIAVYSSTPDITHGIYDLSGTGTIVTPAIYVAGDGIGEFHQSGQTSVTTSTLTLGSGFTGTGTYDLQDGTLSVTGASVNSFGRGVGDTGNFVQSGGRADFAGDFSLGTGGRGTCAMSGGSFSVAGSLLVGEAGTALFQVLGGEANIATGSFTIGPTGALSSLVNGSGLSTIVVSGKTYLDGPWQVSEDRAAFGRFDVLTSAGGIKGSFDSVTLPGPDWQWGIDSGKTLWVQHVPEPATLALLAFGGATMLWRKGKRPARRSTRLARALCRTAVLQLAPAAGLLLAATSLSQAQVVPIASWDGAGTNGITATEHTDPNTQWNLAANWSPLGVPWAEANIDLTNDGYVRLTWASIGMLRINCATPGGAVFLPANVHFTIGMSDTGASLYQLIVGVTGGGRLIQEGGLMDLSYSGSLYVGRYAGSSGVYELDGGTVWLYQGNNDYTSVIGFGGTGTVIQTDGNFLVGGLHNLFIGHEANSVGRYELHGGLFQSSRGVLLGVSGSGSFYQDGGTANFISGVRMAYYAGSTGDYQLVGPGQVIMGGSEYVGYAGAGTLTQSDGNHDIAANLYLGNNAAASGSYALSGIGRLTVRGDEMVGTGGRGTFVQVDGNHSVSGTLFVGYGGGSTGTYALSGASRLVAGNEYIGNSGTGTFTQTDGNNTVLSTLIVGNGVGSTGTYALSGASRLVAENEYIGNSGTGTFTQTEGNNTVLSTLLVGNGGWGNYELRGASRLVAENEYIGNSGTGTFTQTDGNNTVLSTLLVGNGGWGNYELRGPSRLLICGAEYVGNSGTGSFTQADGNHTVLGGLYVGYNAGSAGSYILSGPGRLLVDGNEYVGFAGTGTVTQSDGNHMILESLYVANRSSSTGTYQLNSGQLAATNQYIGNGGAALFAHSGGTNTVSGNLCIGWSGSSTGTYRLSGNGVLTVGTEGSIQIGTAATTGRLEWFGGSLTTPRLILGARGTLAMCFDFDAAALADGSIFHGSAPDLTGGTLEITNAATATEANGVVLSVQSIRVGSIAGIGRFAQNGGNSSVSFLYLGYDANGAGSYLLAGPSRLTASSAEYVGYAGAGTLTQSDGNNMISGSLYLANSSIATGTYQLRGGQLAATREYIGAGGAALFTQSGGTNTVGSTLYVGFGGSATDTYRLGGGALTVSPGGSIQVGTQGTIGRLEWFGGSLTTPTLTLGSWGTLAMGFGFDAAALADGSIFHGSAPGLTGGTVEITNGATATLGRPAALRLKTLLVGSSAGSGVFSQSDGNSTLTGPMYLGYDANSAGTYRLIGNGLLAATTEYIGYKGSGLFSQSDGNNILSVSLAVGGELYVGAGVGTYRLSGGRLKAASEYIGGNLGIGSFEQSGGVNTASYAYIGVQSRYVLTDGVLTVNGRLDANGLLDLTAGDGLLTVSGGLRLRVTGEFDLGGGTLAHIDPNLSVALQSDGNFHVVSGIHRLDSIQSFSSSVLSGTTMVDAGASLIANRITQKALTVSGSVSAGQVDVGLGSSGYGVLSILDANARVTISGVLTIASKGSISAVAGCVIHMTGSTFQNQSTDANALAGLGNLMLLYESADANYDTFEVAGRDFGADANGFTKNFGLHSLQLGGDGGPGRVMLVDQVDNRPTWTGTEALYLQGLVVNPGSELVLNGIHVYVNGNLVNPGDGYLYGGGWIGAVVPEPATLVLATIGALALTRRRRA